MQINPLLLLAVAFAGGIGAVLRYLLDPLNRKFPLGTLIANTLATAIGAVVLSTATASGFLEVSVVAGLAGGLSTFSSYIGQTAVLLKNKAWMIAIGYTAATFVIPSTVALLVALYS